MPASTAGNRRPALFEPNFYVLFVLVVCAALVIIQVNRERIEAQLPPEVARAETLNALLVRARDEPDNVPLRLTLAQHYLALQQPADALAWLESIDAPLDDPALYSERELLLLRSYAQQFFSETTAAGRDDWLQAFEQRVQQLDVASLSTPQHRQVAELALSLGGPLLAARHYHRLADSDDDRAVGWLRLARRYYLEAEAYDAALNVGLRLLEELPEEQHLALLQQTANELIALNRGDEVLPLIERHALGPNASPEALHLAVDFALALNAIEPARHYLDRLITHPQLAATDLPALSRKAIQLGLLNEATQLTERFSRDAPESQEQRAMQEQLAQLYIWQNRAADAVAVIRKLGPRASDAQLNTALENALVLQQFASADALLDAIAQKRPLTLEEIHLRVVVAENLGQPERGIAQLQALAKQNNRDRAWQRAIERELAELQYRAGDAEGALATWQQMEQRYGLRADEATAAARIAWLQGDSDAALAILANALARQADEPSLLRLQAQIAWYEERDALAQNSLRALRRAGQPLDPRDTLNLILASRRDNPEYALALAREVWTRYDDREFLYQALEITLQLERPGELSSLLAGTNPERFATEQRYWVFVALAAGHHGDTETADRAFRRALVLSAYDRDIVRSWLWYLVNSNDTARLSAVLPAADRHYGDAEDFWQVLGAAHLRLAESQQALHYYGRLYPDRRDQRELALALADALDLNHQADAARQLRQHVFRAVASDEMAGQPAGLQLPELIALATDLQGEAVAARWLRHARGRHPEREWRRGLAEYYSAGDNSEGLASLATAELTHFQQAVVANTQYDLDAIEHLLAKAPELDSATRSSLMQQAHYDRQAYLNNLETLEQTPASQRRNTKEAALSHSNEAYEGFRTAYNRTDDGNLAITQHSAELLAQSERYQFLLGGKTVTVDGKDFLSDRELQDEQRLAVGLERALRRAAVGIELGRYQRDDADLSAWRLYGRYTLDEAIQLRLQFAGNQIAEVTNPARVLAERDFQQWGASYAVSARDRFSLELTRNHYRSRDGNERLGDGVSLTLSHNHSLFFQAPHILLSSELLVIRNDTVATLPQAIRGVLQETLNVDDLIPERFGQFAFAVQWEPQVTYPASYVEPRPRLFGQAGFAWQWEESTLSYTMELGLRWQLLGRDEMTLSYAHFSEPLGALGDSSSRLSLSYQYRFGR